jgi:hypothetical protein
MKVMLAKLHEVIAHIQTYKGNAHLIAESQWSHTNLHEGDVHIQNRMKAMLTNKIT